MSLWSEASNRTRAYYFMVAALGMFVLVLALGREHRGHHAATAKLRPVREAAAFRALSLDEIQSRLIDEAKPEDSPLSRLNLSIRVQPAADGPSGDRLASNGQAGDRPAGEDVLVTYAGADGDVARETVNQLCQAFAARRSEADHLAVSGSLMREQHAANVAVEDCQARRDTAQQQLDDFDAEHGETLANTPIALPLPNVPVPNLPVPNLPEEDDEDSVAVDVTAAANTAAEQASNEQLQVLDRQVQILSGQLADQERIRRQYEARMTVQHPKIVAVNEKIAALREHLSSAQLELEREEQLAELNTPVDEIATEEIAVDDIPVDEAVEIEPAGPSVEELESQRAVLLAALQKAQLEWDAATERQEAASEDLANCQFAETWAFEPADVTLYKSPPTPLALLVLSGALAMVAGSGMLFAASGVVRTVDSVVDAERVLGVPVIGQMKVAGEARPENYRSRARFVRYSLLFFEITLGVFLFGMLLSAMLADDFASQLRTDPLSAMADGLARLWQIVLG